MQIIDAQLHDPAAWLNWEEQDVRVRWDLLTELTFALLDSIGAAAVVMFGTEDWAEETAKQHPDRFASVPHVNPEEPDLDNCVAEIRSKHKDGILGLRAVIGWPLTGEEVERFKAGVWDGVFTACEKHQVPLFMFITGDVPLAAGVAERHPGLTLIIDHIGLRQPPLDTRETPPFKSLPDLLSLAQYPNVAVKLCGLPALSSEPFPYRDVQPYLRQIVDAFGPDRLMWASDISRFYGRIGFVAKIPHAQKDYEGKHTYAESMHFIRDNDGLSDSEKEWILGGTVRKLLDWQPAGPHVQEGLDITQLQQAARE
jgi:L-fuconolactonase